MKKRLVMMAAVCCMGLLLVTGCSKKNETKEAETTVTAQNKAGETETEKKEPETKAAETEKKEAETKAAETEASKTQDALLSGKHHAEINIRDYGKISVELDADTAPISVSNFVNLANEHFYDGLTFHRIIKGFMIQGGDPNGNGTGGSENKIKGEFAANGVKNELSHTRGAISMARSQMPDSASSQFFIVHQDSDFLDGNYAVFGYVTEGIEIVDQICDATPVTDNNGSVNKENQPVIESVVVID